jgi:hypothetical protein
VTLVVSWGASAAIILILSGLPTGVSGVHIAPSIIVGSWNTWAGGTTTGCGSYRVASPTFNTSSGMVSILQTSSTVPCVRGPVINDSQTVVDSGFMLFLALPALSGTHSVYENLSYDIDTKLVDHAGRCGIPTLANYTCGNYAEGTLEISVSLWDMSLDKLIGKSPTRMNVRSMWNLVNCWGGTCSNYSGVYNAGPVRYTGSISASYTQYFRAGDAFGIAVELWTQMDSGMIGVNDALHGSSTAIASMTAGPSGAAMVILPPGVA